MNRRDFLKIAGLAAGSLWFGPHSQAAKTQRPNIVFIMSDDHAVHRVWTGDNNKPIHIN